MFTSKIKKHINQSILCWLATSSSENEPNVSPKEIFTHYDDATIIVANIASPQTVKNIEENNKVCISFIDVFVQKGYQLKGTAKIIKNEHPDFQKLEDLLLKMTEGKFPFSSITKITIEQAKPIIAPKYLIYPETTEQEQIESAKKSYLAAD